MELEKRYQDRLDEWLKISSAQWEQLLGFGVSEGTDLELDYSFSTETEESARALATAFHQNFGSRPEVRFLEADDIGPAIWAIHGTTAPTPTSPAFLSAWVNDLVRLGALHDCLFEGWGTYPPQSKPTISMGLGGFNADPAIAAKYTEMVNVYVPLSVQPLERGEQFDQPLQQMLEEKELGAIVRSGSVCDIGDEGLAIVGFEILIRVADYEFASKQIRTFLVKAGAPESLEMDRRESDTVTD